MPDCDPDSGPLIKDPLLRLASAIGIGGTLVVALAVALGGAPIWALGIIGATAALVALVMFLHAA